MSYPHGLSIPALRALRRMGAPLLTVLLVCGCGGEDSSLEKGEEVGSDVLDQSPWGSDVHGWTDLERDGDIGKAAPDVPGALSDEGTGEDVEPARDPDDPCAGEDRLPGCPCDLSKQCAVGWCVEAREGKVCAGSCLDGCEEGWACVIVGAEGPDVGSACVPMNPRLCHPCAEHGDCRGAWGSSESWCLELGVEGRFCGSTCQPAGQGCPEGFVCEEVLPVGETAGVHQCVPEAGICDCPPSAEGLETTCAAATVQGWCPGARSCGEDGLSECAATTTDPDECRPVCTKDVCRGGGCEEILEGWCLIEGGCFPEGSIHPLDPCRGCRPALSVTEWSPRGGEPCDDEDPCTAGDLCRETGCAGTAYVCEDNLVCTTGRCTGDGGCDWEVAPGKCAIGGECLDSGVRYPLDSCLACRPSLDAMDWSTRGGEACDDGDPCTFGDSCGQEGCSGSSYACDDGLDCTLDSCKGDGSCGHDVVEGACLYRGACLHDDACADDDEDETPNGADCAPEDPAVGHKAYEMCNGADDDCNGEVDDGLDCRSDRTGTAEDDPGTSCARIKADHPASEDGVYWLKPDGVAEPFRSYCDMTTDGGGWTLVMKIDGNEHTFRYASALWENEEVYAFDKPDYDENEAKLAGFFSIPLSELRLGVRRGETTAWGTIPVRADSLRRMFEGGVGRPTAMGKGFWTSYGFEIDRRSCFREGFNAHHGRAVKVRLGFNWEGCCGGCVSYGSFGIGLDGSQPPAGLASSGNYHWTASPGFAWVFVRRSELLEGLPGSKGRPASSCKDVLEAVPEARDGVYWIKPDGAPEPFRVLCDMSHDGGGWTLLGRYSTELALRGYHPSSRMEQDEQVGRTVTAPPELFKDEVFGHVDHTLFEVNGRELMLECRRTTQAAWHRVQRSDIFTSWTSGDKGTYGDTAGWGIIAPEGEHGRSSWSVCGSNADQDASPVAGIGYCKGVDPNFGASSHMASVGFADNAETGEPETLIGCNGTGIAEGGRLRVWIR